MDRFIKGTRNLHAYEQTEHYGSLHTLNNHILEEHEGNSLKKNPILSFS